MTSKSAKNRRAGEKIVALIDTLGERESAGVTELADHLSLPKSTVHYHLDLLRESGFVVQRDREYRLGLRFLELGEHTRNQIRLYEVAKPEIKRLAEKTDELALLMVEQQGLGVYLHKEKGDQAMDIDAPIGKHAYLHNRALGKAILAFISEERVRSIIDQHGLPKMNEKTITDEQELFEELSEIREREISYNDQESIEGLRGVGVPIHGEERVRGAISIAGPTARMKGEFFKDELPELLQRARNVIELTIQNQ